MKIKLLTNNYDIEKIYKDFVEKSIDLQASYFSNEEVLISECPTFPIYMGKNKGREEGFKEAIKILMNSYITLDRDIHLNKYFWYSLFLTEHREYLVKKYPEIITSQKSFNNIILKPFNWENYVYKCVLAAEYIYDASSGDDSKVEYYINLIVSNLDVYNYLIKYSIFRNSTFIMNFLVIIAEEGLSEKMKRKIPNRPDLGADSRYGRQVIYELNKMYPAIMSPMLDIPSLREEILKALSRIKSEKSE